MNVRSFSALFLLCDRPPTFSLLPMNNRLWQWMAAPLPTAVKTSGNKIRRSSVTVSDVNMWLFSAYADERIDSVRVFFTMEMPPKTRPEPYSNHFFAKFPGYAIAAQSKDHLDLLSMANLYCHFWHYGTIENSTMPVTAPTARARNFFFLANMTAKVYTVRLKDQMALLVR